MALVRAVHYDTVPLVFVLLFACLEHLNLILFTAHSQLSLESGVIVQLNARVQSMNNDTVNVAHNKAVTGSCFLTACRYAGRGKTLIR